MTKRRTEISIGSTFGSWTTVTDTQPFDSTHARAWVRAECACGTTRDVAPSTLTSGLSQSCGCRPLAQRTPQKVPVGTVFGRLTTISPVHSSDDQHNRPWVSVRCECGTVCGVAVGNLKAGNSGSCGCARRGTGNYTRVRDGKVQEVEYSRRHHGMSKTPLYRKWKGMRGRCEDEKQHNYRWYGGDGIKVCEEWKDFVVFHAWAMANGYAHGLEIDRRDSEGDYCPSNCRWRTKKANIRDRDLYWSDELDVRLVAYAAEAGCNPYDVITQALEKFLPDT